MARKKKEVQLEPKFGKQEDYLTQMVVNDELSTARSNADFNADEFEALIDKIENIRAEKNYDWQSDINLGLMVSHLLTEVADWAAQEFQTRDFCDILLEGDDPDDTYKAKAAKLIINKTLNESDVYHFHKRIRAKIIAWMIGEVYCLCYWEKEFQEREFSVSVADKEGNVKTVSKKLRRVLKDRFNYEVLDPRNVLTNGKYAYSAQQKDPIFVRSERTITDLKRSQKKFGYFNLELLAGRITKEETETSKETYNNKDNPETIALSTPLQYLDIVDRYGKIWAIVKELDEDGNPTVITPGFDDNGNVDDAAELVEAIVTYANPGRNGQTLIRFQPTWAVDSLGRPFKPLVRGLCYIHPSKDKGLSDGKNLRELDTAANDTFNVGQDRMMLATIPVMKGKKYALEDNPTLFFAPGNIMHLEQTTDIEEFKIQDNIQGALGQLSFIKNTASEMDAKWPTTMGGMPEFADTTATAVNGGEQRTNRRGNLKALTWTYTFDTEFYKMILNMFYMNAEPETAELLMGKELAAKFDPNADCIFVPISTNVEAEFSKNKKVNTYDQIMGRLAGMAQFKPQQVFEVIAHILSEQTALLGGNYQKIAPLLENLVKAPVVDQSKGATSTADAKDTPTSNATGAPMSDMETYARGMK